jgi:hypothetical protein
MHAVGEIEQADAIVVGYGAEGQDGGQFRGDLALLLETRAELLAAADVDGQHHRQLAFLDEAFDERVPHAGGDVPVDGADVVAGLVFADFLEGDAGALEDAVVFAAEKVLDGPAGSQLQAADLAQEFAGEHH